MMEDPTHDLHDEIMGKKHEELPPSPPQTEENDSESSEEVDIPLPPPTSIPMEILDVDKKTPDAHVPRDPRLIRLTGVHPFNVEAPLSALFNEGFLTSPELFYVRNHGTVPEIKDEEIMDWEFSVEGFVNNIPINSVNQLNCAGLDSSKGHLPLPSAS
jgi:nitrate reductase (NAD(P)H)